MEFSQQYQRLSRIMSASVKFRVLQLVPLYLRAVGYIQDPLHIRRAALEILRLHFRLSSPEELEVLAFFLIATAALRGSDAAEFRDPDRLKALNEFSQMTSLRLQMTMDRRSKFISTLSQMMKTASKSQDTLVQNIK